MTQPVVLSTSDRDIQGMACIRGASRHVSECDRRARRQETPSAVPSRTAISRRIPVGCEAPLGTPPRCADPAAAHGSSRAPTIGLKGVEGWKSDAE